MAADKETKSSRTENRKMNQRKKANQGFNQGSSNPEVTKSKQSKFNKIKNEAAAKKRKKQVSGMLR